MLLPQIGFAKTYLVSVGISDYPGTENDLRLPSVDATSMRDLYRKNKGSVTKLLIDSEATISGILSAMKTTFAAAGTDDIVVFYFAGHGSQGKFRAYDGDLTYDRIRAVFANCKAKNKMIFADACHSGKMRTTGKAKGKNTSKVMLFLAARASETSLEYSNMNNGLFTTCLLDGLKGAADDDRNRIITAKELFKFVSKNVKKMSNNTQHPVMWGNFPDTMPVMKWK